MQKKKTKKKMQIKKKKKYGQKGLLLGTINNDK